MRGLRDRILGPSAGKRRRRALLGTLVALVAALIIAAAQATPPQTANYFELDKNLINDEQTPSVGTAPDLKTLGSLGGNINATQTSFTVCQNVDANPTTPITIQVEAERMTVGTIANATGGGCSGAFKRTYSNVTRGADVPTGFTTDPASHGASGVQGYVTQLTFDTVTGDDWDQVKAAVDFNNALPTPLDNPCSGAGWDGDPDAVACDFIADPPDSSPNGTVFTGGGSKDDLDINEGTAPNFTKNNWKWTSQSVPDADDIANGYAIKYQDAAPGSHQFIYFGADRTAVNGAKDMGFWFFKDPEVGLNDDGTFSGQHVIGDILVLGTFTQGGATTTIRVFKWVGTGGNTNNVLQTEGTFGDCVPNTGPGSSTADGCNTVNNGTIHSPWAYQSKISGTPADTIFAGGAMEGGLDLTGLGLEGCFSSFMAETRSAPEIGAQLKDFLIGEFEACGSTLVTTPKTGGGDDIPAGPPPGLSIGTGSVTAKDSAVLNVTGTGTTGFTGTLSFFICGPIASGTCDTGGVPAGSQTVTANGTYTSDTVTLTSAGRYCWRGEFDSGTTGVPDASDSSSGECFQVNPVTPTLTTTAVEPGSGLSPTIRAGGLADLNGSGAGDGADDSTAFYGDTDIINGALDCDNWTSDNDGTAGDGVINGDDDCTLIGVDGTADGVEIGVVDGAFATADGVAIPAGTALPTVFNAGDPDNPDIGDSDFAWSTIFGKVDSNGNEVITGTDCHFGIIGDADILGNDPTCGSGGNAIAQNNGKVDLNGDGVITAAGDSCFNGCFFGRNVANGLVVTGTVPFGENVYDIATLTGTATQPGTNGPNATYPSINATNGAAANGTITFTLKKDDCTTNATGTGLNPEQKTVSGDGDYQTSGFEPDAPGDYHWQASYDGSSPNTLAPPTHNSACEEDGEDVTVQQIPTEISTAQKVYPNDSATITSSAAGDNLPANGTVIFRLYDNATCTDADDVPGTTGLLYKQTVNPVGGAHSVTVSTTNTSVAVDVTDDYYWRVTYATGDQAHTGRQSDCVEHTNITFTNDSGPGTLFP